MENKIIENPGTEIYVENVGFHGVDIAFSPLKLRQYISGSGIPVYAALISPAEYRRINRELCGMSTCCCGSRLAVLQAEPDGSVWVEVDPDSLSQDWDELFGNE